MSETVRIIISSLSIVINVVVFILVRRNYKRYDKILKQYRDMLER